MKNKITIKRATTGTISVLDKGEELLGKSQQTRIQNIPLDKINPNKNQPRQDLEKNIDKLKESIDQEGLLQPIILGNIQGKPGHYIIVAGHRRFKAHQLLNKDTIKAIVHHETYTSDQLDEKALLENLQRENLRTYEVAETLFKLNKDKSFNVEKIEKLTGYKKTQIYGYIKCHEGIKNKEITRDQLTKLGIKNCIKILNGDIFPPGGIQEKNSHSEPREARKKSKSFFRIVIKDVKNKDEIEKAIKASENQLLELRRMLKRIKK